MSQFVLHTPASAPAASRLLLEGLERQLGFVPNLYAKLAEAPTVLEAYVSLAGYFKRTSLSPTEQQVIVLAASVENGCEFCVAAHSMIARRMAIAPDAVVDALRDQRTIPDARLEVLAEFVRAVVRQRGWLEERDLQSFLAAGFTKANALEVVLGVGLKTISNYVNHIVGTPLNEAFAAERWNAWQRLAA